MDTTTITRQLVADDQRITITAHIFGIHFPMRLEPYVFTVTSQLSSEYNGGYWQLYTLCNGGFYMAPNADRIFHVSSENGFSGTLSADALGVTACLYVYSHLSFDDGDFAETCAAQYHLLRVYMLDHAEAAGILRAID